MTRHELTFRLTTNREGKIGFGHYTRTGRCVVLSWEKRGARLFGRFAELGEDGAEVAHFDAAHTKAAFRATGRTLALCADRWEPAEVAA